MPERISQDTRSRMMSGIKSRDTKPELQVRKYLHGEGYRFRLSRKDLPGRPDVVLSKWKVAIFVHGCFWHGHKTCGLFRIPKTRAEFWTDKIGRNSQRDQVAIQKLLRLGWRVAIVWECALRANAQTALSSLVKFIQSQRYLEEISVQHDFTSVRRE